MGSPQSTENQSHENKSQHERVDSGVDTGEAPSNPPAPPNPEDDSGIVPTAKEPTVEDDDLTPENVDIFTLQAVSALRLLCRSIDLLVQMTGDVPPTPPIRSRPPSPSRRPTALADRKPSGGLVTPKKDAIDMHFFSPASGSGSQGRSGPEQIDGVPFKKTPIGSPEAGPSEPTSAAEHDIGYNAPPIHVQYGALARRFYSKRPPPISTEDYLMRMHKYCPMSTAVYLATSRYITRLALVERIVPVTPRNVHRLLLAGLRVAMKALEDMSWPHSRFSKVGGVSESELGKLEVTFCFLMDFALKVDATMLQDEAETLCRTRMQSLDSALSDSPGEAPMMQLKIPEGRLKNSGVAGLSGNGLSPARAPEKRKASSALPSRPAIHVGSGSIEVMGQS